MNPGGGGCSESRPHSGMSNRARHSLKGKKKKLHIWPNGSKWLEEEESRESVTVGGQVLVLYQADRKGLWATMTFEQRAERMKKRVPPPPPVYRKSKEKIH